MTVSSLERCLQFNQVFFEVWPLRCWVRSSPDAMMARSTMAWWFLSKRHLGQCVCFSVTWNIRILERTAVVTAITPVLVGYPYVARYDIWFFASDLSVRCRPYFHIKFDWRIKLITVFVRNSGRFRQKNLGDDVLCDNIRNNCTVKIYVNPFF